MLYMFNFEPLFGAPVLAVYDLNIFKFTRSEDACKVIPQNVTVKFLKGDFSKIFYISRS